MKYRILNTLIDTSSHCVTQDDKPINLTNIEFNLLLYLVSQDDWTPETLSILNKQSFVYVGPYVGMDVCLTKRIHFTFRLDWMLAFAQKSVLLPTGPRLYVGFMFCH